MESTSTRSQERELAVHKPPTYPQALRAISTKSATSESTGQQANMYSGTLVDRVEEIRRKWAQTQPPKRSLAITFARKRVWLWHRFLVTAETHQDRAYDRLSDLEGRASTASRRA